MTDGISVSARFSVLRRCSPDSTWPVQGRCAGELSAAQLLTSSVSELWPNCHQSSSSVAPWNSNSQHLPPLDSSLIVTPVSVSMSMWVGEMTSLIESYYQSVQSDARETVHQDSDEEDDGNNEENDSKDESLSQSNSSTSAIVSTNSVRFLIIRQHQLIYWQSCNIEYTQLQLTIIFLWIVNIFVTVKSIFISLSTWPPSPSTSISRTPTPWWRQTWSAWGAAPPPSSTWSGQSSAGAAQTAGTCRVSGVTINNSKMYRCRLKEILSELWKQVGGGVLERCKYIRFDIFTGLEISPNMSWLEAELSASHRLRHNFDWQMF